MTSAGVPGNTLRRLRRIGLVTVIIAIAGYVIWGRVESARLSRQIAEIERRGELVDLASSQKMPETEEQRRCAQLYLEAAERAQERSKEEGYRFSSFDVDRTVPPIVDLAELETTYRNDDPALQLLDQATPLDFAGFGSIAPEFSDNQWSLVTLSALNALRADLLSKRGDGDAATRTLIASVRLQRAMSLPFYRYMSVNRLLGSLRILLRHTSPGAGVLLQLQRAFEQLPEDDGLPLDMMWRRVQFLRRFKGPRSGLTEAIAFAAFRPVITHSARRQLSAFEEAIAIARQPWPQKLDAAAALQARYPDPSHWKERGTLRNLIEQGPPAFGIMSLNPNPAGLDVAMRNTAVTVLALERYRRAHGGAIPPALDALVPAFMAEVSRDPFSGKPLVYGKDAGSYIVYSVDVNRRDDGGALWGIGAMTQSAPRGPNAPRDAGIRVPLAVQH
jgi:hypothetical protein